MAETVEPMPEASQPASVPRRRRGGAAPPLFRAPAPPEWRRQRLRYSGLPRVPGLNHDSAEGRRYRAYCLDLLARAGLGVPVPGAVFKSLREAGRLTLDLDRLAEAEAAEQCQSEPRQQELRRLRSEQRRARAQILTHERIVLAIGAEYVAAQPDLAQLLSRRA